MRRLALALLALSACSPKHIIIGAAADALGGQGSGWGKDNDPQLVADAVPFVLKTIDSLLDAEPKNVKLLLAGCSSYTEYAYAFVQQPAEMDPDFKPAQVEFARQRARNLLGRAYGYCLRGLDARHEGWTAAYQKDHQAALAQLEKDDVPTIYWTAASLALRISAEKDNPALLTQLGQVGELGERALALDEAWDHGSLHELMEGYEASRPAVMGGSLERAKAHRDAALRESEGKKLGPWLTWAEDVDVAQQNRAEFDKVLDQVLAFDVDSAIDFRLANVLAQRRAQWLKAHQDDLFVSAGSRPAWFALADAELGR